MALVFKRQFDSGTGGGVDRDTLPASDFAGPNRSYPIVTPKDVADAARLVGHASDPEAVKRRIIAIARRKGPEFVARLPQAWKDELGIGKAGGAAVLCFKRQTGPTDFESYQAARMHAQSRLKVGATVTVHAASGAFRGKVVGHTAGKTGSRYFAAVLVTKPGQGSAVRVALRYVTAKTLGFVQSGALEKHHGADHPSVAQRPKDRRKPGPVNPGGGGKPPGGSGSTPGGTPEFVPPPRPPGLTPEQESALDGLDVVRQRLKENLNKGFIDQETYADLVRENDRWRNKIITDPGYGRRAPPPETVPTSPKFPERVPEVGAQSIESKTVGGNKYATGAAPLAVAAKGWKYPDGESEREVRLAASGANLARTGFGPGDRLDILARAEHLNSLGLRPERYVSQVRAFDQTDESRMSGANVGTVLGVAYVGRRPPGQSFGVPPPPATLAIRANYTYGAVRSPFANTNSAGDVYAHELGHAIAFRHPDLLQAAVRAGPGRPSLETTQQISKYANTNEHEYFAEFFSYITRPGYKRGSIKGDDLVYKALAANGVVNR